MKAYINAIDTEGDRRMVFCKGEERTESDPLTNKDIVKLIQQLAGMLTSNKEGKSDD